MDPRHPLGTVYSEDMPTMACTMARPGLRMSFIGKEILQSLCQTRSCAEQTGGIALSKRFKHVQRGGRSKSNQYVRIMLDIFAVKKRFAGIPLTVVDFLQVNDFLFIKQTRNRVRKRGDFTGRMVRFKKR